jgi:hypothetical protein
LDLSPELIAGRVRLSVWHGIVALAILKRVLFAHPAGPIFPGGAAAAFQPEYFIVGFDF